MRLLVTAFVLRALVPAGYMPDFGAAAEGVFKVVICTAAGAKPVSVDLSDAQAPTHDAPQHDEPCAFSGLAATTWLHHDVLQTVVPVERATIALPRLAVVLPPTRAGPALGSRAPPKNS